MDPLSLGAVPSLGQAVMPLMPTLGTLPVAPLLGGQAASRCCQGSPSGQTPGTELLLAQNAVMQQVMMAMLTLLMELLQGRGAAAAPGAAGGLRPGAGGSGGGGGGGSAPAAGGSSLSAPPADPSTQIPSFGPNPSKQQINQMLEAAARKYGIPPDILKAVAYKESGWNPNAVGDGGKSFGMMQIYTAAHPDYDVARGKADPSYNIEYAARMLAGLYKQTGNWHDAVRRYNGSGPMAEAYANDVFNRILPQKPWLNWL
jgi:hypothetical protein